MQMQLQMWLSQLMRLRMHPSVYKPTSIFPTTTQVAKYSAGAARYRMAGLGFGLPLSRLYARYFGGELKLVSMPGYGVDAYLHIKRLENYSWEEQHAEQSRSA